MDFLTPDTSSQRFSPALWLASFAAVGPLFIVAPGPVLVGASCLMVLFGSRARLKLTLLGISLAGLGGVRAALCVSQFVERREEVTEVLRPPTRCVFEAEVLDSPTVREDLTRLRVESLGGECEGKALPAGVVLRLYGGPPDLARGDVLEVIAQLGVTRLFRNHELADPIPLAASKGITGSGSILSCSLLARGNGPRAWIDHARAFVRERINGTFAPNARGMARALVLGENDLTEEEDHSFKVSGLAHLLAVSGTHLVFAVVSVTTALSAFLRKLPALTRRADVNHYAYRFGAFLALIYADFAGGSGSAWRAAWMLSAGFIVKGLGRQIGGTECVAMSILVGLSVDPLVSLDLSFLLSIAATAGLMTWGRVGGRLATRIKNTGLRKLTESMVATFASTLPCSVLLAPLSNETSLVGLIANTLAAPFGETIALPLCLAFCLTAWTPFLEMGVALVASGALLVVRQMALVSARGEGFGVPLPFPDAWQYGAAFAILSAVFSFWTANGSSRRRRAVWVLAAGLVQWGASELRLRWDGEPHRLRVTFLDVEQGDSALVDLPDGKLVLIDGGGFVGSTVDPGRSVILPVLRKRRRTRLDAIVLSHPHPDHFGGLLSVISALEVGELWDTGQGQAEGAGPVYEEILRVATKRRVTLVRPAVLCARTSYGGAELDVLAPCPDYSPNGPANDNSFVLRFVYDRRSVLFVGDAEHVEETQLLSTAGDRLQAEVLKVGHHGSRTSTSDPFLDLVRPRVALVSCGIRNRFGHPHAVTMERLARRSIGVWRTDQGGSWSWPEK